jgi:segregation and condensation protein B
MTDHPDAPTLNLTARLEALLFVAPEPVTVSQLATVLEMSNREVEEALRNLQAEMQTRGLRVQHFKGRYQLTTAPETANLVELFLGLEATSRLSKAALEALAIVAYQQPVTRPQIDAIRGVNSDGVLKSLLSKGLIEESGRTEGPGRPILYVTTTDFLQHFGLNSLAELPVLELEPAMAEDSEQAEPSLLKD